MQASKKISLFVITHKDTNKRWNILSPSIPGLKCEVQMKHVLFEDDTPKRFSRGQSN